MVSDLHFPESMYGAFVPSLCEVEDPGCIWGRIVKGPGAQVESPQDYENLQVKMNLFYHNVNLDVQKVKPSSLEKGQV